MFFFNCKAINHLAVGSVGAKKKEFFHHINEQCHPPTKAINYFSKHYFHCECDGISSLRYIPLGHHSLAPHESFINGVSAFRTSHLILFCTRSFFSTLVAIKLWTNVGFATHSSVHNKCFFVQPGNSHHRIFKYKAHLKINLIDMKNSKILGISFMANWKDQTWKLFKFNHTTNLLS